MTNNETLKVLINWVESQPRFKPKSDLKRMTYALEMKQIDLKNSYMVHVAGTNGKGSVAQFLTQIFLAKGLSVGTFTSPYILNFNERIHVNGKPLTDEALIHVLAHVKEFNTSFEQAYGEKLSFFELLTLASLMVFQHQKLDVVIMEVGIGGLLDATNAYQTYDVSLITSIGFDHMKQLGNTLESIAFNKLGILRQGGTLLTTVDEVLHPYFIQYAKPLDVDVTFVKPEADIKSTIPLVFKYQGDIFTSGLSGAYQVSNAILAIEVARKSPFDMALRDIQTGLRQAYLPARFESIKDGVIVDGAHNIHAIDALKKTIRTAYPKHTYHIVFSALADKDITSMLESLMTFTHQIDLVSFPDPRFESLAPFAKHGIRHVETELFLYLDELIKKRYKDELIIITGSLHFVGYVLNHYK